MVEEQPHADATESVPATAEPVSTDPGEVGEPTGATSLIQALLVEQANETEDKKKKKKKKVKTARQKELVRGSFALETKTSFDLCLAGTLDKSHQVDL